MLEFFRFIYDFITNTIPEFIVEIIIAVLEFFGVFVLRAINVVVEVIFPHIVAIDDSAYNYVQLVESNYGQLPADALGILGYCNVPLAFSIIIGAYVIRRIRAIIPFV